MRRPPDVALLAPLSVNITECSPVDGAHSVPNRLKGRNFNPAATALASRAPLLTLQCNKVTVGLDRRGAALMSWIPAFVFPRGNHRYERRNPKDISKFMNLVWFWI